MKYVLAFILMVSVSACSSPPQNSEAENSDAPDAAKLMKYQASEFEPNWFLSLTNGDTLEFTQLDPVKGNDLVTFSYSVTHQKAHADGLTLLGEGSNGNISIEIMTEQNCSHSGSGYLHRDSVLVTTSNQSWRGCGGPILEEEKSGDFKTP